MNGHPTLLISILCMRLSNLGWAFSTPSRYTMHHLQYSSMALSQETMLMNGIMMYANKKTSLSSSSSSTTTTENILAFESNPMPLYIEDTDAYGVMFNSNYIKFYERALDEFSQQYHTLEEDITSTGDIIGKSDWTIAKVTSHKFKASPKLGQKFVICGQKLDIDMEGGDDAANGEGIHVGETWELRMIEFNESNDEGLVDGGGEEVVYNTAIVTIISPSTIDDSDRRRQPLMDNYLSRVFSSTITTYRDELRMVEGQTGGICYNIPIRSILNYFERLRTESLGGPAILRQMKEDDGIMWVVTSIDDLVCHNNNYRGDNGELILSPGQDVVVESDAILKRKGMICQFNQKVIFEGPNEQNNDVHEKQRIVIAQGTVTLCALKIGKDGRNRPTSKIPQFVRDLLVAEDSR